ncbi:putative membrane protein YphA (DoxX/SURF4 family) [Psychromicrobium silvestre]|uniref:Putative membrane protein YphA (DoxX/SURF4 family) n=1 Tax=Psychromicrobium silvestre TaxID=1645614 RepID=A0A7Y9S6X7_9MICC|nr:DoxX family protein [Psychromicrobium silvestre]NYE94851.1 putative membrane protein YphA (DoxX/SURF4 family) [Psychromicrobium silvestre]
MSFIRTIARPLLASTFIVAGVERIRNADETAQSLGPVLRPLANALPNADEKLLARAVGGVQVGAGVLLAIGKLPRFAGLLLTVTSTLNTVAEFSAADTTSGEGRRWQRAQLLKNVSLLGGVLLASVDTAGKPGLAWRAEHLTDSALKAGKKASKKQLKAAGKTVKRTAHEIAGAVHAQ